MRTPAPSYRFCYTQAMTKSHIRAHALALLVLFCLQFLSGMTLNLFVTLPNSHPGTSGSNYLSRSGHSLVWALSNGGGVALTIHALLALLIFLASIALSIGGFSSRSKLWGWTGAIASIFTVGALFNGLSFLDFNIDISSMIMATCWLVALISLVIGLIKSYSVTQKA
jgi:hypothetical protein